MKSPLCERPIFHHLERRVETHIFLCVLAYHLLVCIERAFLEQGIHTSWETLRRQLSTHQVVTVRLPTTDGTGLGLVESSRANSRNWKSSVGDYVLRVSLLSHPRTSSNGGCSHGVLERLRREFSKELVLYARQILI